MAWYERGSKDMPKTLKATKLPYRTVCSHSVSTEPPLVIGSPPTLLHLLGVLLLSLSWKGEACSKPAPILLPPPSNPLQTSNLQFPLSFLSVRAKQKCDEQGEMVHVWSFSGFGSGNKMRRAIIRRNVNSQNWALPQADLRDSSYLIELLLLKLKMRLKKGVRSPVNGQRPGRLGHTWPSGKDSLVKEGSWQLSVSSWGDSSRATEWLGLVQEAGQTVAGKASERLGVQGPLDWSQPWGLTCLATSLVEAALSFI